MKKFRASMLVLLIAGIGVSVWVPYEDVLSDREAMSFGGAFSATFILGMASGLITLCYIDRRFDVSGRRGKQLWIYPGITAGLGFGMLGICFLFTEFWEYRLSFSELELRMWWEAPAFAVLPLPTLFAVMFSVVSLCEKLASVCQRIWRRIRSRKIPCLVLA